MFECSKCGLCCQHIDMISELSKYDSGNGRCKYLTEDNLCAIYADRPEICNVDTMYEKNFSSEMTKQEFYDKNLRGCRVLKEYVKMTK
ncbi:Fe-S-cluster containining protein [Lachnospiraceae bacterium PM6-15]|uniref:YkgJ family cysteine cluster protein n=1 Tax=Ohessyouella blattaphilus TaxID=2949333 RepID=UPI003E198D94